MVLWLNEIQRYLYTPHDPARGEQAAAALTSLLHDPGRGPVLIVGTLWHDTLTVLTIPPVGAPNASDPHQQARALLRSQTVIPVAESFDAEALDDLRRLAERDARLAEALERGGTRITQYLAGARELLNRYHLAPVEARAVLDAAADARRLGVGEALPEAFLYAAAAAYLDSDHWRTQTDAWRATWFTRATTYTDRPCHGVPGPLTRDVPLPGAPALGGPFYRLADTLQQHTVDTRRYAAPPAVFWDAAADHLSASDDLTALGQAAEMRLRFRHAVRLYEAAAAAGNTSALATLALMWERIGDDGTAERIAQQAAAAGSSGALALLAHKRKTAGDREGAECLARQAAAAGSPLGQDVLSQVREPAIGHEEVEDLSDVPRYPVIRSVLKTMAAVVREWADDNQDRIGYLAEQTAAGNGVAAAMLLWMSGHDEVEPIPAAGSAFTRALLARMQQDIGIRRTTECLDKQAAAGNMFALLVLVQERVQAGDHEEAMYLAQGAAAAGFPEPLRDLARRQGGASGERLLRYGLEADGRLAAPWWGEEA
ncbi:hypothetical protein [Streptomyces sp. 7N604]|uniref:hypothetical protein n=1 Tax=Streptomyces sp. 7N604 TaxID=3457415 RepID=UPI003FD4E474